MYSVYAESAQSSSRILWAEAPLFALRSFVSNLPLRAAALEKSKFCPHQPERRGEAATDPSGRTRKVSGEMERMVIENISFEYVASKLILKDISMTVEAGEFLCFLGQSGCGKSTLLRLLAGLERPTSGRISMDGREVAGAGLDRGVVFQDYGLFPWMSAGDNIMLALRQRFPGRSKGELKDIAMARLREVGFDDAVYKKLPRELSGGMQQRVAIAQAFAIDPPVLLMDEPFGALDAVTRAMLQDLVLDLWSRHEPKKTVFFVTHDVDEALLLASRIVVLGQSPSSIIFDGRNVPHSKALRDAPFENPKIVALRQNLIRQINKDVAARLERTGLFSRGSRLH